MDKTHKTNIKTNMKHFFVASKNRLQVHKKLWLSILAVAIAAPLLVIAGCYLLIVPNSKFVLNGSDHKAIADKHISVGIVLGAGITKDGKPYKELQSRLDAGATALQNGEVQKLLLSGDNRFPGYDEPTAMRNYLVMVKHIDAHKLQADYAGRSTYESCDRANKVFGLHKALLFSAGTHLPRAMYLCRHFGIETYGISSGVEANNAWRRELVARPKAVFNLYIYGENTLLGPKISL